MKAMKELRQSPLERHHREWLKAHPERSETWLRERLADGFIIHHADGNPGALKPTCGTAQRAAEFCVQGASAFMKS
jgi:hypothetical protein